MSAPSNRPIVKEFVKFDGDYFPLPLGDGAEEELYSTGEVVTSALEGFSPSVVAGDASVVDEQRIAVLSYADWSPGMGKKFSDEQDSLGGYAYGNLNTLYPNMAVLPPKQVDLGGIQAGYDESNMRWIKSSVAPNGLCGYSKHDTENRFLRWDGTSGAGAWVITAAMPDAATTIRGACDYGGYLVICTDKGIVTTVDVTTFTARWNTGAAISGFYGPVTHDNKVYAISAVDLKMYWTNDPTLGSPWGGVSAEAIALRPGEAIVDLFEWKNRAGTRAIHILTTQRLIAYDDDDFFTDVFPIAPHAFGSQQLMSAAPYPADQAVYLSTGDTPGAFVWQVTNDAFTNVNPNKGGGFPKAMRRAIGFISPSLTRVYALGGNFNGVESYYGGGGGPANSVVPGWIMAYNGAGWHCVAEGPSPAALLTALRSCAYLQNQVIFHYWDVSRFRVYTVYVPENGALPYDQDHRSYAEGTYYLVSAETDAGLENTDKTGRYFEIKIEKQDGTAGLPTDHEAELWVSFDGAAFVQYGTTATSATAFPWRIPLPGPTVANQQGIVWKRMSWMIKLRKNVGAAANVTPILRSVAHAYTRSPIIYDGFQVVIDLSRERFKNLNRGLFRGKSRTYLRNKLRTMMNSKLHYKVEWGTGNTRRTIKAAEVRINARENAGTGFGQYVVTGRDVSVPE